MSIENVKAALVTTSLTKEQMKLVLMSHGVAEAEAEQTAATLAQSATNVTATTTMKGLTAAITGLITAAKGLWAALKSNPLFWIVTAVTAVITVFNKLQEAADEAAERYEENFNKLTEASKAATDARVSVGSLIEQYKELADASNGAWSVEEANELKGIQEQITALVGDQAGNLDLVNGKIDEEYQKLLSIYSLLSDEELSAAESAYNVSQERLEKGYSLNFCVRLIILPNFSFDFSLGFFRQILKLLLAGIISAKVDFSNPSTIGSLIDSNSSIVSFCHVHPPNVEDMIVDKLFVCQQFCQQFF